MTDSLDVGARRREVVFGLVGVLLGALVAASVTFAAGSRPPRAVVSPGLPSGAHLWEFKAAPPTGARTVQLVLRTLDEPQGEHETLSVALVDSPITGGESKVLGSVELPGSGAAIGTVQATALLVNKSKAGLGEGYQLLLRLGGLSTHVALPGNSKPGSGLARSGAPTARWTTGGEAILCTLTVGDTVRKRTYQVLLLAGGAER